MLNIESDSKYTHVTLEVMKRKVTASDSNDLVLYCPNSPQMVPKLYWLFQ